MTKILLADHQCLFRAGMVRLIDSIGGFGVSGEVDSAEAAVEFVAQHTHRPYCCWKFPCWEYRVSKR